MLHWPKTTEQSHLDGDADGMGACRGIIFALMIMGAIFLTLGIRLVA